MKHGAVLALFSALLFGASPAFSKFLAGEMSAALLAGFLYLGSALGLLLRSIVSRQAPLAGLRSIGSKQLLKLSGAVLFGGILAPLCLAYAILNARAFDVSVLLNFEAVATSVIAWWFFHEHVPARVWGSKTLILAGAIWISMTPGESVEGFSLPALAALTAAVLWGIDNNLTRDLEELPATTLATLKGLAAGTFNVLLGLTALASPDGTFPGSFNILSILLIGALGYGLSLVLFIRALRLIGAARTGTLFAAGPFFGMILSVAIFRENPPPQHWGAAALIALGVWYLIRERHEHLHLHEPLTHSHVHSHDDLHHEWHHGRRHPSHAHAGTREHEHKHEHSHEPVTHSHPHWPDVHHRHSHQKTS